MQVNNLRKGYLWFFFAFVAFPMLAITILWFTFAIFGYTFTTKGTDVFISLIMFFSSIIFRKQLTDTLMFPALVSFFDKNGKDSSNIKANYLHPPIFTGLALIIASILL